MGVEALEAALAGFTGRFRVSGRGTGQTDTAAGAARLGCIARATGPFVKGSTAAGPAGGRRTLTYPSHALLAARACLTARAAVVLIRFQVDALLGAPSATDVRMGLKAVEAAFAVFTGRCCVSGGRGTGHTDSATAAGAARLDCSARATVPAGTATGTGSAAAGPAGVSRTLTCPSHALLVARALVAAGAAVVLV